MSEEGNHQGGEGTHNQHLVIQLSSILLFFILGVYTMFSAAITNKKSWFHESSLAIFLGLVISGGAIMFGFNEFNQASRFNDLIFFYVLLPPIVFSSGYNLKRRRFFQNFNFVGLFGIIGTLVSFATFALLTFGIFQIIPFNKFNPLTGDKRFFEPTVKEILLFAALMSCTDIHASVSCIHFDQRPKLFSIVYGESLLNDAITIILFNQLDHFIVEGGTFMSDTVLITENFLIQGSLSVLFGMAFAVLYSLIFKHLRFLTHSPVHETILIYGCGQLSYIIASLIGLSGIISILTCGITLSHYAWYNLSPQGKQATSLTVEVIGYGSQAFVFIYQGLTFFSYNDFYWSYEFVIAELFIVFIARYISILLPLILSKLFGGKKIPLNFRELQFLFLAGLVRGTIAFALVLKLSHNEPN